MTPMEKRNSLFSPRTKSRSGFYARTLFIYGDVIVYWPPSPIHSIAAAILIDMRIALRHGCTEATT